MPTEDKALIDRAVALKRTSLNDWAAGILLRAARRAIRENGQSNGSWIEEDEQDQ